MQIPSRRIALSVYDIESKKFERCVHVYVINYHSRKLTFKSRYPALAGPWDIILARRADVVLVSYHNKVSAILL